MQNHQPLTPAEALEELQKLLKDGTDVAPDGWYTIRQLEALWGVAPATAHRMARRLLDEGMAEMKNFKVDIGAFVRSTPHYKFHARPLAKTPTTPMASRVPQRLAS